MRGVRDLTALAAAALLVVPAGCSSGPRAVTDERAAAPSPGATDPTDATDATTPGPVLPPVVGERVPAAHWVDSSGLLTQRAEEFGPSDTILPFAHLVGDWLDAHLDALQRGGPGRLGEVAPASLLAAATDADLATITSGLASPDAPVAAAVYRLGTTYHTGPEWLTATVEVTSVDGAVSAATLVFVPGPAGPELVLFGPAEATPPVSS